MSTDTGTRIRRRTSISSDVKPEQPAEQKTVIEVEVKSQEDYRPKYLELLGKFKDKGKDPNVDADVVLLIQGNRELIKCVIVWCKMVSTYKQNRDYNCTTEQDEWDWLWKNTDYPNRKLMDSLPGDNKASKRSFEFLKNNRVIYPDCTCNYWVQFLIQSERGEVFSNFQKTVNKKKSVTRD